jgi:HEAT repeat protein
VAPLLRVLDDATEQPSVRGVVAEALTGPRSLRAVPHLVAALRDPHIEVRFWAAFALGELGDASALPSLEELARTDDGVLEGWGTIRDEASAAVESIRQAGQRTE